MSMESQSSAPLTPSPRARVDQPRPSAEPSLVGNKTLANRFAQQLERKSQGDHAPDARHNAPTAPHDIRLGRHKHMAGEDDDASGDGGAGGTADALRMATPAQGLSASSPITLPDTALFDRIAAQIAEIRPGEGGQMAHLTLPEGSLAQAALIAKGPDGSLSIRITGLDPRLGTIQADRLRAGLVSALSRRKIHLAGLTLDKNDPQPDQRGRASTTSRVV